MAAMVGVTTVPAIPAYAAQTADSDMGQAEIAENAEKYGLTENIEDGAILHCWCWSFDTIKENMADIAAAGFTSIQTSPANECNDTHPNMKLMGSDTVNGTDGCWWWHYQPTDWKIGNYQLGTRDDFEAMCDEADKYGIKVIVDVYFKQFSIVSFYFLLHFSHFQTRNFFLISRTNDFPRKTTIPASNRMLIPVQSKDGYRIRTAPAARRIPGIHPKAPI